MDSDWKRLRLPDGKWFWLNPKNGKTQYNCPTFPEPSIAINTMRLDEMESRIASLENKQMESGTYVVRDYELLSNNIPHRIALTTNFKSVPTISINTNNTYACEATFGKINKTDFEVYFNLNDDDPDVSLHIKEMESKGEPLVVLTWTAMHV